MSFALGLFYLLAALAVIGALATLLNGRNPVAAAASLAVTMVALGVLFLLLEAHLLAILQLLVWVGGIVAALLLVPLVFDLRSDDFGESRQIGLKVLGVCVLGSASVLLLRWISGAAVGDVTLPDGFGGYRAVGRALYTDFVLPFEVSALLLLVALVGAVVMAKRNLQ